METGLAKLYQTISEGDFQDGGRALKEKLLFQVEALRGQVCDGGKRCRYFGKSFLNKDYAGSVPLHTLIENSTAEINSLVDEVLRKIPAMVFVKDQDLNFLMVNQRICDFLDLPEEEILGHKTKELIPQWDFLNYEAIAKAAYANGENAYNIQDTFVVKGKTFWVVTNLTPLKNHQGETCALIGVSWDVTELKNYENYLQNTTDLAQAANKARGLFVANLSHEIRTPITSIVGMTEILKQTDLNDKQKEYLDIINSSGKSLLNLVDDVLDMSKIEAGNIRLINEEMNLHDLLKDVYAIFRIKAEEKNLDLQLKIDENIPVSLLGDVYRIKQVLFNLLNNAIKFTDAGRVVLEVKLKSLSHRLSTVFFSIKDTGIGISEKNVTRIFETFSQGDLIASKLQLGAGLGLPICRGLVKLMHGQISVKSQEGIGSEFTFEAVFEKGQGLILPKKKEEHTLIQENLVDLNAIKILLAEDNYLNQKIISHHLTQVGMDIDIANDGEKAWKLYLENEYDLILMDVQMPLMNGFQATDKIRSYEVDHQIKKPIPIIALTANAMKGDKEDCLAAGMSDYISKPFFRESLLKTVRRNIGEK